MSILSEKMNVAHVIRRMVWHEWGGTEAVVAETSKKLLKNGHNVRILTTSAFSCPGKSAIQNVPIYRFSYHYPYIPLSSARKNQMDKKGGNPISFGMFRYLLMEREIQLVHLHTVGRLAAQVRTACKVRGIPYVITLHGGKFLTPKSELEYFSDQRSGCFDYGKIWGAVFGSRKVLSDAAAIICVGRDEYLEAQSAFPSKKVVYFPNGVNPEEFLLGNGFRIRQKNKLDGKKIILCVGRLDPQKNQLSLIKAMPDILRMCPNAYLVFVGANTVPSYHNLLREEIQKRKLEEFALLIPGLPPSSSELKDWYAACDVFALPSIHEPFGIVVLEAWSCSKPVVVSKAGNLPVLVTNGVNGAYINNDSSNELSSVIGKILLNEDYAKNLGRAGRNILTEYYTWEQIIKQLQNLYEEVLRMSEKNTNSGLRNFSCTQRQYF